MTTATETLTDFLLARIAEDEAMAERSKADNAMNPNLRIPASWINGVAARVLAECEAHRRIVEIHADYEGYGESCRQCAESDIDLTPWPCPTLRVLATVYADHAGYREEWRP